MQDPYRNCLKACRHDLGRGMTVEELWGNSPSPEEVLLFATLERNHGDGTSLRHDEQDPG